MEPFSLTCHSCAVKLKVANPQLVGQTLACPKCGTMIQVQHPTGWKPPVPDSVASQSAISDISVGANEDGDFGDIDDLLSDSQRSKLATVGPEAKKQVGKPGGQKRFQQPLQPANEQAETDQGAATSSLPTEKPILPGQDWSSQSARDRKKLALMVGSAIATVFLVVVVIVAMVNYRGGNDSSNPANDTAAAADAAETNQALPDQLDADDGKPDDSPLVADGDNPSGDFLDDSPTGKPASAIPQTGALADASEYALPSVDGGATGFAAPKIGELPELGAAESASTGVDPKPQITKLSDVLAEREDPFQQIDQKMGSLASLLASSDTSLQALEDAPVLLSRSQLITPVKYNLEKPTSKNYKFEKLLELPVTGIATARPVSLARAARILMTLSGIPISIDARQFALMGVPTNPELKLQFADQTVLSAAEKIAEEIQVQCWVGDQSMAFTLQAEPKLVPAELEFPKVGQLSDQEKQRFVNAIQQLIAPEIWTAESSPATIAVVDDSISVSCPIAVQQHIRQMIDRLNAAVVLADDPEDSASLAIIASRSSASQGLQQEAVGWAMGSGQSIGDFLNRIERVHGLTVLVDWEAATARGWTPATIVPGDLVEPTVGEAVVQLARSLGLSVIGIDERSVQLTASQTVASVNDLEVYPCSTKWATDVQGREVEQLLFQALGSNVGSSYIRIVFEPKCRAVIVVAPQPLQRQVEALIGRLNQATEK